MQKDYKIHTDNTGMTFIWPADGELEMDMLLLEQLEMEYIHNGKVERPETGESRPFATVEFTDNEILSVDRVER